ncbi:MAG: NADH-quinone oxidoreductase subunit I [Planctomycetota bacterium]|jgi:ferredoxin
MAPTILDSCPVRHGRAGSCAHCKAACPAGLDPHLDNPGRGCVSCGSCDAACPLGAPRRGTPPGENTIDPTNWVAACSRVGASDGATLWPCLGSIRTDTIIGGVESGAENFRFLHGKCSECRFSRAFEAFRNRLPWVKALLGMLGVSEDSIQLSAAAPTLPNPGRRDLFRGLFGRFRETSHSPRKSALEILPRAPEGCLGAEDYPLEHSASLPGAWIQLRGDCDFCGLCVCSCPTEALKLASEGGSTSLVAETRTCINCGTCAERCPREALSFSPRFSSREALTGPPRTLARGKGSLCPKCGTHSTSPACPMCSARDQVSGAMMHAPATENGTTLHE